MSRITKRKHVTKEVLEETVEPQDYQMIVKILGGRGNNLHEAETPEGVTFLVSMPTKFRRNIWIKRGDYVIVDPIAEGNKVQAEIAHILYPMQIKHLKDNKLWPLRFTDKSTVLDGASKNEDNFRERSDREPDDNQSDTEESDNSDNDDDLFINTNRITSMHTRIEESSSSSDEQD